MNKRKNYAVIITCLLMVFTTACDPQFDTLICQEGVIKLVPHDNTSGSEWAWRSNYVCGVNFDDASQYNTQGIINYGSNGSFQLIVDYTEKEHDYVIDYDCAWLPSASSYRYECDISQCGYENPSYVVIYCNDNDELTISEKTCAEYLDNQDSFTP